MRLSARLSLRLWVSGALLLGRVLLDAAGLRRRWLAGLLDFSPLEVILVDEGDDRLVDLAREHLDIHYII